jgi:SPP1 family predicted phage head-tail adaptor
VTLFTPTRTPDGAGGFTESWSEHGSFWARITPLTNAESLRADRLEQPARLRVELRAPNPVQTGWRLFWRERWHRIDGVEIAEQPDGFTLLDIVEIVA